MHGYIGKGSHNLLLRRKLSTLLEFKIANGTRKGQIAIDTAEVDEAARGADSSLFACVNTLAGISKDNEE